MIINNVSQLQLGGTVTDIQTDLFKLYQLIVHANNSTAQIDYIRCVNRTQFNMRKIDFFSFLSFGCDLEKPTFLFKPFKCTSAFETSGLLKLTVSQKYFTYKKNQCSKTQCKC